MPKGIVDQRIELGFNSGKPSNPLDDPVDESFPFEVKTTIGPPPQPYWLILPVGLIIGLIYLGTRT